MSVLSDKLKQVSRGGGRAIGFGAAGKISNAPILLIVAYSQIDQETVNTSISEKADLLLFDVKDPADHAADIAAAIPDDAKLSWGVRLSKADKESVDQLAQSGCDYVILDSDTASQVLQEEKMGKILEVDINIEDSLLRTVSKLMIDAVYVKDKQSSELTISHLMNYHRVSGFAGKPSIIPFPKDVSELESLCDAGIKAVILELGSRDVQARIKEAKEAIEKLPPAGSRKSRDKGSATLSGFKSEQNSQNEG